MKGLHELADAVEAKAAAKAEGVKDKLEGVKEAVEAKQEADVAKEAAKTLGFEAKLANLTALKQALDNKSAKDDGSKGDKLMGLLQAMAGAKATAEAGAGMDPAVKANKTAALSEALAAMLVDKEEKDAQQEAGKAAALHELQYQTGEADGLERGGWVGRRRTPPSCLPLP